MIVRVFLVNFLILQTKLVLCEVPIEEFFPFGLEAGDSLLKAIDDGSSNPQQLDLPFPFFGVAQSTLWVNENGIISFVEPIHDFKPWCNPVVIQYRMIAPFWADVDTRCGGEVYFRQTTNDSVLKKANQEIANAFPEMQNIHLKWAFIATWYNVTNFQDLECKDEEDRLRNTFQILFVTNGTSSFAIYYYNEIEWTTGDVSDGVQAQAGYDFGDRTHRASLNGSCTPAVINLTLTSNVNSPGKWILNTQSSAAPLPSECQYSYTGDFCLVPNTIDTLGGVFVAVSGITLSSTETAICRYYDPSANVTEIDAEIITLSQLSCLTPMFFTYGRINMEIEILNTENNEIARNYTGYIYVTPIQNTSTLGIELFSNGSVKFSWDVGATTLVKDRASERVKLVFMKFCDFAGAVGTIVDAEEKVIAEGVEKAARELLENSLSNRLCNLDPIADGCKAGFFLGDYLYGVFWGGKPYNSFGNEVNSFLPEICSSPFEPPCGTTSEFYESIPIDIPNCPPTEQQALLDPFFMADTNCYNFKGCYLNPGAENCYYSSTPSPSGGAQQCCYKNGQIFIQTPGAGFPFLAHPSIRIGIPHFEKDQNAWLNTCGRDINSAYCQQFYQCRPPNPGINYTGPQPALGNGDPHFTTFDGLYYTFNGAAEFWLLQNNEQQPIAVQARIQFPSPASGWCFLGVYALKSNESGVIQIDSANHIIYYEGIAIPPDALNSPFILNDVTVKYDVMTEIIFIIFSSGLAFQMHDTSSLTAYALPQLKGNYTHGLLGSYDGNPFNDLTTPNGILLPANSTTEVIHYKFGLKWLVKPNKTLFNYFNGSYDDYYFPEYKPSFGYSAGQIPPDAEEICGDDQSCIWDLIVTGNASYANLTRDSGEQFNNTVSGISQNISMCPHIQTINNGYINVTNYFPNSSAVFACFPGYELQGNSVLFCQVDAQWNGTEPICVPKANTTTTLSQGNTTQTSFSNKFTCLSKFSMSLLIIAFLCH